MAKKKLIPNEIIKQFEVKSARTENRYIVTFYDNCVSCTCPAGGKKQLCKHVQKMFFNNLEYFKENAPIIYNNLIVAFEAKNNKELNRTQKLEEYAKVVYVNKDIAEEAWSNAYAYEPEYTEITNSATDNNSLDVDTTINKTITNENNDTKEFPILPVLYITGIFLFFFAVAIDKIVLGLISFVIILIAICLTIKNVFSFLINKFNNTIKPTTNNNEDSGLVKLILKFGDIKPKFQYIVKHIDGVYNASPDETMQIELKPDCVIFQNLSSHTKEIIKRDDIADILLLEETEEIVKEKSVIPRVVVGALILGVVGGIIGGLSATKIKENKKYYIQLSLKNGKNKVITGSSKILQTIYQNIKKGK